MCVCVFFFYSASENESQGRLINSTEMQLQQIMINGFKKNINTLTDITAKVDKHDCTFTSQMNPS